ncbi:MAG: family 43 glycosylhydrolase [Prevotella sp.]|nr:family 43 glycosylhydrolase [Prevotella sp.]
MRKLYLIIFAVAICGLSWGQGVKPLPTLSVDGRWLVDQHGNHVVLHGVMDTPNAWFNGGRWGWSYSSVTPCINYFEKLFTGLETAKCDVFRLHMDPAWTNDPNKQSDGKESGEADISRFSSTRLKNYLRTLYFPLAKRAMNHRMFVVVRPPGVCPGSLQVGDYYNDYLMTVWDIFTQNDSIKKYSGQISIELANEPVSLKNANGEDDPKALHDFFQPIVDKIRANGFTGIIWAPGTGWQANYTSYAAYPIEGYNIGYAVHDYCGWYGCSDENPSATNKIEQFHRQVPVVDTNPVIITEVDWSPKKEGTGHYNEHGDWVESNWGTWATGSTSKWGKAFKAMLDHYGNISMTLSGTACLIDIDTLLNKNGKVVPAFDGYEEACGKACMDWYAEYYDVDWAHADYKNVVFSDQGNGKYKNPIIAADFPDPDVIRVGDTYYMVSTTMHHFPGATIVKSRDLVNWEYCAQPLKQLSSNDNYSLLNGQNAYAKGMWACSMKYHEGRFYILLNCNDAGGFVLSASDPEGKWDLKPLPRIYYDPGMLFDNGKVYVACGNTEIKMCELDEDFNFIQEKTVFNASDMLEGCHLYHIGDYYYIYATYGGWPSGQTVLRSKNIFGPYEEKLLLAKTINNKPNTIHQGSLLDTPSGEWWTIMQEDVGCFGRMPNMQPVKWVNGWPVVGNNGIPYSTYDKPDTGTSYPRVPMPTNDSFRSYPLGMQWQWNHNPDDGAWSLFERPGWLRLKTTGTANKLTQARNMLTQRIFAFSNRSSTGTVRIDVSHLQEGDRAGICILQDPYAMIAVEMKDGQRKILWRQDQLTTNSGFSPSQTTASVAIDSVIYLRASVNYSTSKTQFYYSLDNKTYTPIGQQTTLGFNLSVFVGARFGLFCYATKSHEEKGYADFDWFATESDYEEAMFHPANFEGFSEDMLTVENVSLDQMTQEVMVGNSKQLEITATYRDGHTTNVAPMARYTIDTPDVISIESGRIRGLSDGTAHVAFTYTDPLGNECQGEFDVRSTFFPFSAEYINTSLFSQGTYDEQTHTFRPGQWGQMGWEYPNGADMSAYKYLVLKLDAPSSGSHLNIFTANSIWSDCYATSDFGQRKQIVVSLKNAQYTSGDKTGQPMDTKNIRIVAFWGNGNQDIKVNDIYLTNNNDFSPSGIETLHLQPSESRVIHDLQGRRVNSPNPHKGIYIVNGKKHVVK